jgi:hypothetical protein
MALSLEISKIQGILEFGDEHTRFPFVIFCNFAGLI